MEWDAPKNVGEIHSFLGLASYYRRFIENFSHISAPITKLTHRGVKFVWSDECEKNFQGLKQKLSTAPVLTLPEGTGDMNIGMADPAEVDPTYLGGGDYEAWGGQLEVEQASDYLCYECAHKAP
ncbi:uncharacterized mitochondrial protein AtMg00860-like [Telopea speciosissima]|uniref:uncharacterized mitochondrial protein AtMg00860-like n=1 Tax=Telopea speciosissima TaxID=54955 RepID=UPI001CC72B00|nr:uncharacterized mitochondrial protein AtMg00860-like [Telopea speciosissima]